MNAENPITQVFHLLWTNGACKQSICIMSNIYKSQLLLICVTFRHQVGLYPLKCGLDYMVLKQNSGKTETRLP